MSMKPLKEDELAERWNVTIRTLQMWRKDRVGPPFARIGARSIIYRMEDVLAYEAANVVTDKPAEPEWRGPVKRAASALDVLANRAATPEAKKTLLALSAALHNLLT